VLSVAVHNKARHGDGFSVRLRFHYKAARAGSVRPLEG